MKRLKRAITVTSFLLAAVFAVACGGAEQAVLEQTAPAMSTEASTLAPASTTSPADRAAIAEARYLPKLEPALAEQIRTQPWFAAMEPAHLELIAAILETEDAAGIRGEKDSVAAAFRFATEQLWYADGFDGAEAISLRGLFQTYTVSLEDTRAPQIGPYLGSTIQHQLIANVQLPESGEVVLLVSADNAELGRRALDLAVYWLPIVEGVTGAFPYTFLHITVTDLPQFYAGLSYDEFIALSPEYVDDATVVHELTHSTLYGIFPTWFEEGFAYFMEHYLTDTLAEGETYFREFLIQYGIEPVLNVGPKPYYDSVLDYADQANGYLFLKGLYERNGTDHIVETIRSLRTQQVRDQELVKRLIETDDPVGRAALEAYVCQSVMGTTRNYC